MVLSQSILHLELLPSPISDILSALAAIFWNSSTDNPNNSAAFLFWNISILLNASIPPNSSNVALTAPVISPSYANPLALSKLSCLPIIAPNSISLLIDVSKSNNESLTLVIESILTPILAAATAALAILIPPFLPYSANAFVEPATSFIKESIGTPAALPIDFVAAAMSIAVEAEPSFILAKLPTTFAASAPLIPILVAIKLVFNCVANDTSFNPPNSLDKLFVTSSASLKTRPNATDDICAESTYPPKLLTLFPHFSKPYPTPIIAAPIAPDKLDVNKLAVSNIPPIVSFIPSYTANCFPKKSF